MRHSMSKDTAFNAETTPRHTFLCSDSQCLPLAISESCAQNMGIRLLENHSFLCEPEKMNIKFHKITSYTWNFQNFTCDTNQNSIDSTKRDLTRAVASRGARGQLPSRTCWARQIKSVDGFVFFRLSYFDYSDLQLFSIFLFEVEFFGDICHDKCWK